MIVALVALLITAVFSVLAFFDIKSPTSCCSIKTEQTQTISETENSNIENNLPFLDTTNKPE